MKTYAVPPHTWTTLPDTVVQVMHEHTTYSRVTVYDYGAIEIVHPEHWWHTRPLPPATPSTKFTPGTKALQGIRGEELS